MWHALATTAKRQLPPHFSRSLLTDQGRHHRCKVDRAVVPRRRRRAAKKSLIPTYHAHKPMTQQAINPRKGRVLNHPTILHQLITEEAAPIILPISDAIEGGERKGIRPWSVNLLHGRQWVAPARHSLSVFLRAALIRCLLTQDGDSSEGRHAAQHRIPGNAEG